MKKAVQFNYTPTCEKQFNIIKQVTLQVDASKIGLGVSILQDDAPVAYASKALTYTEH